MANKRDFITTQDFTRQELDKAIIDYQRRDRRFGGVK